MNPTSSTASQGGSRFRIGVAVLALFFAPTAFTESLHFNDSLPPEILASGLVELMTDREILGQTLMFGYEGKAAHSDILHLIAEGDLGSVKVFGWNTHDLIILAGTLGRYQKEALGSRFGIPLLVSTDQEGGWVRHVKGATSQTPGNMALGASGLPYDAWMTGRLIGEELAALGINMNFAPTVDVISNIEADVIGPRAFSADAHQVGLLGLAFFRGQEETGVISTAKHFPGHGDSGDDSHSVLPSIHVNKSTLRNRELVPYRSLIAAGVPAVMVGHLAFPGITGNEEPATLSKPLITGILREELGFQGLVITDDLFMYGVRADGSSLAEVCERSLEAGADILLISNGSEELPAISKRLLEKMTADADFKTTMKRAAERVIETKARHLKGADAVPLIPDPLAAARSVPAPGAEEFFFDQACRSITALRSSRLPLPPEQAGRVLLVGSYKDFLSEGQKRYSGARTHLLTGSNLRSTGRNLARSGREYDTVIALLPDADTALVLNELAPLGDKVVILSVLSPVHLRDLDWVSTVLTAYGSGQNSFAAAFAVLAGDFKAAGTMPISLSP